MNKELEFMLIRHEGYRKHIYTDTTGNRTIGIGFNLEAGLTCEESKVLLRFKIKKIRNELMHRIPVFNSLSKNRQDALIDMAYNLGVPGLMKFKKMLAAIDEGNFDRATMEMGNSKWATQVGRRAVKLQELMKNG